MHTLIRDAWTSFVRQLRLDASFRELTPGRDVRSFQRLPPLVRVGSGDTL